jgi:hypothetical protein
MIAVTMTRTKAELPTSYTTQLLSSAVILKRIAADLL